jgi:protein tyrosine/serine phosphatase
MLLVLCEVMKFNPEMPFHNKERLKAISDKRHKDAEEKGVSIYEMTGMRGYYLKNKEKLNKKRTENYRKLRNQPVLKKIY